MVTVNDGITAWAYLKYRLLLEVERLFFIKQKNTNMAKINN